MAASDSDTKGGAHSVDICDLTRRFGDIVAVVPSFHLQSPGLRSHPRPTGRQGKRRWRDGFNARAELYGI
jgi:hypothetical protein